MALKDSQTDLTKGSARLVLILTVNGFTWREAMDKEDGLKSKTYGNRMEVGGRLSIPRFIPGHPTTAMGSILTAVAKVPLGDD